MADNIEKPWVPGQMVEVETAEKSPYSDEQVAIAQKIHDAAVEAGVDPVYALSIAHIENGFNTGASPTGATGPMQLTKGTADYLGVDRDNIDENIKGGVTYLKEQLNKFKDPYVAGIAYNGGPGMADEFIKTGDSKVLSDEAYNYYYKLRDTYKLPEDVAQEEAPKKIEAPTTAEINASDKYKEAIDKTAAAGVAVPAAAYAGHRIKKSIEVANAADEAALSKAESKLSTKEGIVRGKESALAGKQEQLKGRILNQTSLAEEAQKNASSLRKAQLAAQERLVKATESARKLNALPDDTISQLSKDKDFIIQHGKLDESQTSGRARGTGYTEHTHYLKESADEQKRIISDLRNKGVVSKNSPVVKLGPTTATPSGILVKSEQATNVYNPAQQAAQNELHAAEVEHQRLSKIADKAENAAQGAKNKLRDITEKGPSGLTVAEQQLAHAKNEHALVKNAMPSTSKVVKYARAASKIPFTFIAPAAFGAMDAVEATNRFKRGEYGGAAISGLGALGGALSMVPPIGPAGAAARLGGLGLSLAVPVAQYAYDRYNAPAEPEDKQATANAPKYAAGGAVKKFEKGGLNIDKIDLANSSKYIDGDSRVSNPYGYVLDDSNSRMDVSPRASLDSAVISDRANLVHNMVAERDRLSDKYLGGAGRFASKGLEKLRDALNSSPAFDESVLYPKSSNLKVGDFLIDEAPEALYDYTTRGLPSFVLGNEWVNNPATGGMMHTNPYADPRALAFLNAWGVETPIVAGAKAAYPLVKSGSKKLLKELATQYETGTGLGKYLIDPTMNIVGKDKGKIIRANDRGEDVTRASRTNKKTGQYVGAPPGVDSPQALGALVNDYVKGMDQGLPGRNFYTDSSSDILGRTGHNMTEADLLAQNLAILSRANNVGGNTTMSAKAHIQAATGEPIRTGRFPSKDSPPLQEMYDAGQAEYLGHKRDPFATQLGVAYAPERIGRGVNDMHEAELMGYPTGKVGGATQHSFMDEVRARAIDKANQTNLGGFNDWNTGNAQAAAWSGNKIRRGDISAGDAAKSYADYFPGHEANATYEAVSSPVTGHLQGLLDAPFEERLNYTLDPHGSWDTSASGRDIGYTVSGLLPGRSVNTVGRFKDSANPAIVARPVIGTETTATGERAMTPGSEGALNAVEASRAYFDAQEAAAWHKLMPAKNADAYTGAGLDFGRDFTKADMERIAPLFESKGYDIGSAPDGVTIMANSKTPKGKEFSKDIKKIIKDNKNAFHGVTTDFGALNSNYINYGDAWKSNIPGSVTKELLKYIDTAPVTGSKLEGSQLYRDTVKARNARDLAAEKSGLGKVRADMVRAREIFAKDGWNGLRKAAEAGIVPAVFLSPNAVPEDWR